MTSIVRTVLGDITPDTLGHVQPHEHVLSDLRQPLPAGASDDVRIWHEAPITLENYYRARREHPRIDLLLNDEEVAVQELKEYRQSGGGTIVDVTSAGLGRDPEGLARVAAESHVQIVMGSSVYYKDYHPARIANMSVDQLTAEVVRDIRVGVGHSGIRAGIIGEVGLSWPHDLDELKVLRASAKAQLRTGAAINIHPARHSDSPLEAVEELVRQGVAAERVVISHIERTIFDADRLHALADTGCILEYDLFGQEMSYYSLDNIDMPNDATRIDQLQHLIKRGHLSQLLISQDICHKTNLRHYGGEGYSHILDHVIPMMRRKGMSETEITQITQTNPSAVLSMPQDAREEVE